MSVRRRKFFSTKKTKVWMVTIASGVERGFSTFFKDRASAIRFAAEWNKRGGEKVIVSRGITHENWRQTGY